MSCRRFEELVALRVGGDLPPREAPRVEAHLANCAGCRQLEAALVRDRAVLASRRTVAPIEKDLEEVRRNVLVEISRDAARRSIREGLGFALFRPRVRMAGLAVAGLVVCLLWLNPPRQRPAPGPSGHRPEGDRTERLAAPPALAPTARGEGERGGSSVAARQARPEAQAARAVRRISPAGEGESEDPTLPVLQRIEIQTADPNIRIIWLCRQNARETHTTGEAGE
jgi:anti-sigma factor RsiW